VLLTRDGLSDRKMYINAKNTLFTLLDYGVIPVVNENDTVATEEIRFGDNDHLAALVASLVEADRLIMLSDVDGLYTANPARDRRARLIKTVEKVDADVMGLAGGSGSAVGTGGMYSKLLAARMAAQNGIGVNIINGRRPRLLAAVLQGGNPGTEFKPERGRLSARKGWIAHGIRAKGALELDAGAVKALREGRKSLLPSGVLRMQGSFQAGDAVYCLDPQGNRIAKGVSNYSSDEVKRIMGRKTSEIEAALGYKYSDEIIHRDNMVIL
jgi:glutamate 5-kinase